MIVGGDGGEEGRTAGGASGGGYTGGNRPYLSAYQKAGVPLALWLTWSTQTQMLWEQDWNRTSSQQHYSTDSDYAKVYVMKEYVDDTIIEPIVTLPETGLKYGQDLVATAQESVFKGAELALLGLVLAVALRK